MKLLPCPFCGDDGPVIEQNSRQDFVVRDKAGKRRKRVHVDHCVMCWHCGAAGPASIIPIGEDVVELTEHIIVQSKEAAAFEWNKRQPITDDAYRLVNALIVDTLRSVGRSSKPE